MPQLVVDVAGVLVGANAPARKMLGIAVKDIGRPLNDLDVSYRPAELRGPIARACEEGVAVILHDVSAAGSAGEPRTFEVVVAPLFDEDKAVIGTSVSFADVTELRTLQAQLRDSRQELETAYEELQSTNEELETTNEELQSTVEELETTNEELQSTNEELETMNEELQSSNEELQTMNEELANRSTALSSANTFLASVFASLRSGVVVVDKEFRVQVWNDRSTDMWGLRPEEAVGGNLLSLDIGLPVGELRQPIRAVLTGTAEFTELTMSATNRRGRPVDCRVTIGPLRQFDRQPPHAAIILIEEQSQPI